MSLSRFARFLTLPALLGVAACSDVGSAVSDVGNAVSGTLGLSDSAAPSASAPTAGLAVADEPLAARSGASILTQGGTAADAVTAMFFTMTATYPVAASLGGGGICLVRQPDGRVQEIDFLARRANANGPFAVPGAVRGFFEFQKAFGTLPWQRTVAAGEAYAATGFPISTMLAQRLGAAQAVVRQDPALAGMFLDTAGQPFREGSVITNSALAQTLSQVRVNGADGFYQGETGRAIAVAAGLSPEELAGYRSSMAAAGVTRIGVHTVVMPGPQTGAGAFAAALLTNMSRASQSQNADAAAASAVRQTLASFGVASVPQDLGATGFAAVDANGQSAACAVTLNGPFGAGRMAGNTGVTLAASPSSQAGYATAFLTPLLVSDSNNQVALAGAGAGGPNGTAAIQYAALKLAGGQSVLRPGDLRSTGAVPFATANAISCQGGFCVAIPDPGANGMGASAASVTQ